MPCLYYECKLGYIPNRRPTSSEIPNLNDVIITDEHSFLYILSGYGINIQEYTFSEFADAMVAAYGIDYLTAKPLESGYDNYNQYIKFWAPGFNLGYEGYEAAVNANLIRTNLDTVVWIVPGLKRVLLGGRYASPSSAFKYENGIISGTKLTIPSYNAFPFIIAGNQTLQWISTRAEKAEDLANVTSWNNYRYRINPNTNSTSTKRPLEQISYTKSAEEFNNLFGNAEDPKKAALDPYAPGGESDLAGGEGDFDNTSVPIDFPDLPTLSAVDTGFITLFNPSLAELRSLATYMWGPAFDLENWKKLFADPMDAILGLSIVPVHVPDSGHSNVKVGNIDTEISMNKAGSQYVEVDCGSLNINEYWGAYLDYEPYTHVQIFLPYIGTKEISTDDVMNKPIHVKYHVDILSGSCVAYLKCGESVLYSFNGQCAASIPVNGRDYTNVLNSAISLVSSAMGMFAMGQAAGALGSAAGLAKTAGSQARLAAGAARMEAGMFSGGANIASSAIDITKPVIQKSGSVSSMAGLLGIQTPYMILTRPRQCLPADQNKYLGYPSLITTPLSSCSGFTRIEAIHLENIGATDEEVAEIESILHAGVIF